MKVLRGKTQQLLQAMEFVNIDRLDELDRLLEQREASGPCGHHKVVDEASARRREFGDVRVIDFLAFARRAALTSSGRGG